MAKIEVRCPICSLWDNIEISDDATKNVSKGLLAINIASGMICEHSFIAYVDKNLVVRDCIVADFKIELPESEAAKKSEESITPETDSIKFDLIKLNIPDMLMVYVFRTIFFGKKALILSDHEFLYNHIVNFFKYVMQNSFEFDLRIISEMDYKKNKSEYKDYLVFKNREIIKDKEQLINPKRLEIEKLIVQKFFAEYDLMAGLIILRNEINKAYEFSKSIIQYLENQKGNPLTSKIIISYLSEKHGEKIHLPYLTFLIDIVRHYFNVNVPNIGGVTDLLGLL
ncbi:MAG: hypothetical protein ACFFB6_11395 [Promethearchaeota archaeon]